MTALSAFTRPPRRQAWAAWLCAAASLLAGACSVTPPPEVVRAAAANPELSLHLVDPIHWHLFEVQHSTFEPGVELIEEFPEKPAGPWASTSELTFVPWWGDTTRWFDLPRFLIPQHFYERYRHSAEYWFRNPWGDTEWMIAAHALSRRAMSFPLPVAEEERPLFMFIAAEDTLAAEHAPVGQLSYDSAARRLFFGRVAGQEVEIEQVGALSWDREPGVIQHLTKPFPESGEFVIRIDGFETARFLLRPEKSTQVTYRLAIRRAADEDQRDLTLGIFLSFDRMREFILTLGEL